MGQRNASYIEKVARDIWAATGEEQPYYPPDEASLYLGYAVLALTKGELTTSKDVHDAWSAWAAVKYDGEHRSLIPFEELTPEIQAYDDLYRDAIHMVARKTPGCPLRVPPDSGFTRGTLRQ